MEGWVPIPEHELDLSREDFLALLQAELAQTSSDLQRMYERYAIDPIRAPSVWDSGAGLRALPVWVIARYKDQVVGYDEVEEEYGTGRLAANGIEEWGTYGERLAWTLRRFPDVVNNGM
jgi:hypothetical protein